MKKLCALTLLLAVVAATPASADRPFGSSNQGPPVVQGYNQYANACAFDQGPWPRPAWFRLGALQSVCSTMPS